MGNLILNSLEIRGFRAFEHLEIERLGRVNLIVGKNNVGKTALLEALQLYVRNGSIWTIREILGMHDENKLPFFSKKFSIDPSLRDLLPAIRYMFHGREEVNGVAKTIHIGPIDTPEETLTVLVGGSVSQNTENTYAGTQGRH